MADEIYDLGGRKYSGELKVTLKPGFGVVVNGEHVEGGPHVLPLHIANDLLQSGRAILHNKPDLKAEAEALKPTTGLTTESISTREPEPAHRDPGHARPRRKK